MNTYEKLTEDLRVRISNFPMFFALNDESFKKGMESLGLTEDDIEQVINVVDNGFIRAEDEDAFIDMFKEHHKNIHKKIKSDKTGDGFIYDMFYTELAEHEYGFTEDVASAFEALDVTMEDLDDNPALKHGFEKASRELRMNYEMMMGNDDEEILDIDLDL